MMPDPEAVVIEGYPDGVPRMAIRVGHHILSLRQADDWALKLLDVCGAARSFEGRESVALTCKRCSWDWLTKQYGTSKCPKCKLVHKVPARAVKDAS